MRRLLAFLAVLLPWAAPALAMSPTEIARAYVAAWNEHDAAKAASYMAEDAVYLHVTVGQPKTGRDAARDNAIGLFIAAVPDLKWEIKGEPVASADGVAFEWTFSGTNTGAWGPETPATGKSFTVDDLTLMRIKDGKISQQGDYYDGLSMQKQLGWIE